MDTRALKEVIVDNEARVWIKVPEATRYFGIPRSRMYELIQRGEFPAVRISERCIRVYLPEAERILLERSAALGNRAPFGDRRTSGGG